MTKYRHRWLNAGKFELLHPKFVMRGTVAISERDYDKISVPVVSNVE